MFVELDQLGQICSLHKATTTRVVVYVEKKKPASDLEPRPDVGPWLYMYSCIYIYAENEALSNFGQSPFEMVTLGVL